MLCTFCPLTILGDCWRIPENSPKSSADKMFRACELKDQTYKKTRTLHFSDKLSISRLERGAGLLRTQMRMLILELGFLCCPCNCWGDPLESRGNEPSGGLVNLTRSEPQGFVEVFLS